MQTASSSSLAMITTLMPCLYTEFVAHTLSVITFPIAFEMVSKFKISTLQSLDPLCIIMIKIKFVF